MKTKTSFIILISFIYIVPCVYCQLPVHASGFDGGEAPLISPQVCLSDEERIDIMKMISINRQKLVKDGILDAFPSRSIVQFEWPLAKDSEAEGYNNIWAINSFVDQISGSGFGDWNCGQRTYDGHKGVDIVLWPFPWHVYEQEYAFAVAAAPGVIILKQDGSEDDHCSCICCWNAVYVEHTDGSVTFYGHLKLGSLTPKAVGESVETGEYLGVVASSGCSTVPHLHFEVYKDMPYTADNLIEPFAGPCNNYNSESWWVDQMDYREPKINAVFTHFAVPVFGCPDIQEHPNFENIFVPGQTIYTVFYFKDQLAGTSASYQMLRPDSTVYDSWTQNFSNTFNSSWWSFSWMLPSSGPFGTWTVNATYEGETVSHTFQYLVAPPQAGRIGVNTDTPQTEFHVHEGALYIDDAAKGLILKGENGSCYRIKINAAGNLNLELLDGCPD